MPVDWPNQSLCIASVLEFARSNPLFNLLHFTITETIMLSPAPPSSRFLLSDARSLPESGIIPAKFSDL
jgi:hypothetical protein